MCSRRITPEGITALCDEAVCVAFMRTSLLLKRTEQDQWQEKGAKV